MRHRPRSGRFARYVPLKARQNLSVYLGPFYVPTPVHADCPFDDWNEMRAVAWDAVGDLDELLTISLWSFARYARTYITPVKNIRALVHGHVTVSDTTLLAMSILSTQADGGTRDGSRSSICTPFKPTTDPANASIAPPGDRCRCCRFKPFWRRSPRSTPETRRKPLSYLWRLAMMRRRNCNRGLFRARIT